MADQERKMCYFQKQPFRGVLKKRCSENLKVNTRADVRFQ